MEEHGVSKLVSVKFTARNDSADRSQLRMKGLTTAKISSESARRRRPEPTLRLTSRFVVPSSSSQPQERPIALQDNERTSRATRNSNIGLVAHSVDYRPEVPGAQRSEFLGIFTIAVGEMRHLRRVNGALNLIRQTPSLRRADCLGWVQCFRCDPGNFDLPSCCCGFLKVLKSSDGASPSHGLS